jgi:predicted aconitase
VNVGTPHFSVEEFGELVALLAGRRVHPSVEFYANTGRHTLASLEARGWLAALEAAGVRLVVDTCTYVTPILRDTAGVVMTCSAKWAWYAPGNVGVQVAFGSLRECVESAVAGRVVRDAALWSDR